MKSIKVQTHIRKYADLETSQKLELIEGLKELVEEDRKRKIQEMKAHLEQLESGTFPLTQKIAPNKAEPKQDTVQDAIFEEPSTESEPTQEEALDNL